MPAVVRFDEFGGPEVLHVVDEPVAERAPGEVLVAIEASGVNPLDTMMRSGRSPSPVPLPGARLGVEAAGTIAAVGPGVTVHRPGDPVVVTAIPDAAVRGSYAQFTTVPATHVITRPPQLDAVDAAAIWVAFATAYGSLVEWGRLRRGQTVLVAGASGSVGRLALQVANALGATPIAVTRTHDRVTDLLDAGAAHVIATDRDPVAETARDVSGGAGVDLALDLVRGPGQRELLAAVRPGGTLVAAGFLDPRPTPAPATPDLTVLDYRGWDHLLDAERMARTTAFFASAVSDGLLHATIDTTLPLDRVVDAHRRFDAGLHAGRKIVLTT